MRARTVVNHSRAETGIGRQVWTEEGKITRTTRDGQQPIETNVETETQRDAKRHTHMQRQNKTEKDATRQLY